MALPTRGRGIDATSIQKQGASGSTHDRFPPRYACATPRRTPIPVTPRATPTALQAPDGAESSARAPAGQARVIAPTIAAGTRARAGLRWDGRLERWRRGSAEIVLGARGGNKTWRRNSSPPVTARTTLGVMSA